MTYKVTKGKYIIEDSDGNTCELSFVMPSEISHDIFKRIVDWRENWLASFEDVSKYFEAEKIFLERQNPNQ